MTKKIIYFSNQQVIQIKKDADEREISFTEMVRRIIDHHYEEKNKNNYLKESRHHGRK